MGAYTTILQVETTWNCELSGSKPNHAYPEQDRSSTQRTLNIKTWLKREEEKHNIQIKKKRKILKAETTNSISFPNKSITSCETFGKLLYFLINTMEIIFPAVTTPLKALNSWLFVEKSVTEKGDGDVQKVWALRTLTFCKWSFNLNFTIMLPSALRHVL